MSSHSSSEIIESLSLARDILSSTSLILVVNLVESHQTAIPIANKSMIRRVRKSESDQSTIESPSRWNNIDVARALWLDAASQSSS